MHTRSMCRRLGLAVLGSILLAVAPLAGFGRDPQQAAHAAGISVKTFYATKAGGLPVSYFEQWCNTDPGCKPPSVVTAYPAGQQVIDLYYDTNFPAPNILDMEPAQGRFSVLILTSSGAQFVHCQLHPKTFPTCNFNHARSDSRTHYHQGLIQLWAPQQSGDSQASAFPADTYSAELLIDGRVAAHTRFRVGSGHPATQPQKSPRSSIAAFYSTSETDYSSWTDFGGVPPRTISFRSGQIGLYFYLKWAKLSTTLPVYIVVSAAGQSQPAGSRGPIPLSSPSGSYMYIVTTPDRSAFADGSYTAAVQSGGTTLVSTSFRIGG